MVRTYKISTLFAGVFFISLFALTLFMTDKTSALRSVFPSSDNSSTSTVTAMVSQAGGGVTLNASPARFKIFLPPGYSSSMVAITVKDACADTVYNDVPNTDIEAQIEGYSSWRSNSGGNCSGNDMVFNVPRSEFGSGVAKYGSYRFKTLVVRKVNGSGIKSFKVDVPSGAYVTFDEDNYGSSAPGGDPFSVWNASRSASSTTENDFNVSFRPTPCNYTEGDNVYLKWQDADYGESNETGNNIRFRLRNVSDGGFVTLYRSGNSLGTTITAAEIGGNGDFRTVYARELEPGKTYSWEWENVDKINGVQLYMPFNEISILADCNVNTQPDGDIIDVSCTSINLRAYDRDPRRNTNFRVSRVNSSGSGTTSVIGSTMHSPASGNPLSYKTYGANLTFAFGVYSPITFILEARDIETGVWREVDRQAYSRKPNPCNNDPPPTADISADCTGGIRIRNLGDENDRGGGVTYVVNAFHGSADTNGNGVMDNGEDADNNGDGYPDNGTRVYFGSGSGDIDFGWPPERTNDNSGWIAVIFAVNINETGANEWAGSIYKQSGNTGQCFNATCNGLSATIASPIPGAPANSVKAGQDFTVNFSARANGARNPMPENLTREDGYVAPLSATIYNNPAFGTSFHPIGRDVPVGSNATTSFSLRAPSSRGSYSLTVYTDYWGLYAVDTAACTIDVQVYQPFRLQPQADMPIGTPDQENPERIDYVTRLSQVESGDLNGSPYTSDDIPSSASSTLRYYRQGTYKPNDFASRNDPGSFGNPSPFNGTWNDTIAGRTFNHGGTTDSWLPGDRYCTRIVVSPATGWLGPTSDIRDPGNLEDTKCADVQNRPFVRTYGADVFGGGRFGSSGGAGGILTYLKDSNSGAGSGGEFAAFAIDNISGYATAVLRSASSPLPSTGLTFANTGAGAPGNFMGSRSVPNYYDNALKPETPEQGNPNIITNAGSHANKGQTLVRPNSGRVIINPGAGDGNGYTNRHAFFVDGDVVIRNNIVYGNTGNYGSIAQIPSFALFVKGNIYIAGSVTQLDGQYVAQPRSNGSGGTIYTCSDSGGNLYDQAGLFNNCSSKLRVNGAFASQNLKLLRTFKTLSDIPFTPGNPLIYARETFDNENSAESFRITPEFFLANPGFRPDGSQTNGKYDYMATLPPIL